MNRFDKAIAGMLCVSVTIQVWLDVRELQRRALFRKLDRAYAQAQHDAVKAAVAAAEVER